MAESRAPIVGERTPGSGCPETEPGVITHLWVIGSQFCECGAQKMLPDGSIVDVRPGNNLVDPWDQDRVLRAVQFGFATLREQLPPGAEFGVFVLVPKAGDEKPRVMAAQSGARHKVAFSVLQWCRGALQDASPEIQRAAGVIIPPPADPHRIILPRR